MNRRMYGVDILVNVGFRSVVRSSIRLLPDAIRGTKFAAGTAVAVDLIPGTWAQAAWAQETKPVSITVPPVLRAEAGSNSQLSIRVGPQETPGPSRRCSLVAVGYRTVERYKLHQSLGQPA
jgi:hypothetical protein